MNILVVAAHPDDEVLGCGGTIAALAKKKNRVFCCYMSEFVLARKKKPKHSVFLKQVKSANKILGIKDTIFFNFPNIEMNTVPTFSLVKAIEQAIIKFKPSMILTHHWGDVNEDHVRTFDATVAAARLPERGSVPSLNRNMIKKILCYEVPSSTEWAVPSAEKTFHPNSFMDIGKTFNTKIKALKKFNEVTRSFPHPFSVKALKSLSNYRGVQVGLKQAEAFYTLRELM